MTQAAPGHYSQARAAACRGGIQARFHANLLPLVPSSHHGIMRDQSAEPQAVPAALDILVENHRAFLSYLARKVGDRALAEDILQDAFSTVVARPDLVPVDDGIVPWFYRTLRNAAIDRFRRRATAERAAVAFAREMATEVAPPEDLRAEICACVSRLAATLKPEYAEALAAIDVAGLPVKAYAERQGLTAANAAVRVFRARRALKQRLSESCGTCADHGCRDCTCRA
jgi:RNA polymerase sigma-70 factor (ECF subfamily)